MKACSEEDIAEKRKIALEKLKDKKSQLIKSINQSSTKSLLPPKASKGITIHTENKASIFINDLRRNNFSKLIPKSKHSVREILHPYKCPVFAKTIEKPSLPLENDKHQTSTVAPIFLNVINCKVYMISASRFEVRTSGYHAQLIEIMKSIPSKVYDASTKNWNFALDDYNRLQDQVKSLKPHVLMGIIPKSVISLCESPPKAINSSCLTSISSILAQKLMPFQEGGVCFATGQHGRAMICDEMGLGKTYQAIAVADFYRDDWPLLICTTASTRVSWEDHIRKLLPSVPDHYVQIFSSNQQHISDVKILITSYNMLERHISEIMKQKFGVLIFDESHCLKNSKAKCTMVANRLAQLAKRVILLSGTPALSRPVELFSQLQMIDRKFMSFMDFTSRYCDGKQTNFGWDASGQSNLSELNVVLKLKFMIRRTKTEVLHELSEKIRETVVLDPSLIWSNEDVKVCMNTVAKNWQSSKGQDRERILLQFYAQTAEVKTRAVCAYLRQLVKQRKKFIVFAHHRIMLDSICKCFNELQIYYIRIDGSTRSQDRGLFINAFQKKDNCMVAVLSLGACNTGITLTAAELIIFAELTWNPSTLAQAESRAHRIGQLNSVTCRYLMASKTADDYIWDMLKNKQDVLNRAGIFCDNLQEASHKIASTITNNKIDNYYSFSKGLNMNHVNNIPSVKVHEKSLDKRNSELDKKIENVIEAFRDDDDGDDIFKDLIF